MPSPVYSYSIVPPNLEPHVLFNLYFEHPLPVALQKTPVKCEHLKELWYRNVQGDDVAPPGRQKSYRWLVELPIPKTSSQIGILPQTWVKIKKWNNHPSLLNGVISMFLWWCCGEFSVMAHFYMVKWCFAMKAFQHILTRKGDVEKVNPGSEPRWNWNAQI